MLTLRKDFFGIFVEHEDQRSAKSSQSISQTAFVETAKAIFLVEFFETVRRTGVFFDFSSGLHHELSSDSVKRVEDQAGALCDEIGNQILLPEGCFTFERSLLEVIVCAKSQSFTEKDSGQGHADTPVHAFDTIGLDGLSKAVDDSFVLAFAAGLEHVSGELSSDEV